MSNSIAADQLRSFIERVENIDAERANLGEDRKDLFTEIKSAGFDVKAVRMLLKERKEDGFKRAQLEELVALYRNALGQIADTPLGQAALAKVA